MVKSTYPHKASLAKQPCVSSVLGAVTVGLEEFITAQGGESRDVLSRSGLHSRSYEQPNQHIPLKHYCNSMHEAARSTGNEHFGLWFGEQFQPEGLGLFGLYAITSADLRSALQGMRDHFPVFQRNSLLNVYVEKDICEVEYRLLDGEIMDRRQDAELTIGMINNVIKRAMGPNWAPLAIDFQHPALVDAKPHRDAFKCDVSFQRERNLIRFKADVLEQTMPNADPMLNNVSIGSMLQLANVNLPELSVSQRVKSEIIELLPQGEACLDLVCCRLNMSARSLQRRLAQEQQSFKSVLDEVREELAIYYLSYHNVNISEIAYRLGYSELSAFTRAFFRWKNTSPSEWRLMSSNQLLG
ncbi:AraC-like transcriptional regulator QhpR [Neptunomonas phycophila]|uniref:AraC-like transcriptional regulator QhpR n=1 Tax=Neptunomonas phycophila TaxID=1572645 RepID=UPI0015BB5064|nr:AraC family transcriptional regulator [Neptunomonas phycophila]QLE99013.1 AraC family transcriptional regulator [Neptunomonas phycophila]